MSGHLRKGDGKDGIGPFRMTDAYDPQSGRFMILKEYVGKHRVFYKGWNV